ncbi:MAG: Crp/Fnr family transcriptional regulator [Ectothiorhodospira sp.]
MFANRAPSKDPETRLRQALRQLPHAQRETLVSFAEFLAERHAPEETPVPEPEAIPRPVEETVIQAMKRLNATYPMLEKSRLLNETSTLMGQHVMQGRPAREVIDELEAVFARHYASLSGEEE